ncbi:centrosomal protein of 164 kDa-like [Ascaphus truei]|uniref:centrosomal protein of 164 kDa-like n=1 Tax=Ascaphus truei TaxID=8439 RepID=UPI003F5A80AE
MDLPPQRCDVLGSEPCPPLRVQHLSESLHRITSDLNGVLGALGNLNSDTRYPLPTPLPHTPAGVSLSAYTSLARLTPPAGSPPLTQWAWHSGVNPSLSSSASSLSATRSVDAILVEKWRKYFPGGIPSLSARPAENTLGYVPAGEQIRMMQNTALRTRDTDTRSVQLMIDTNKKWLENFRNDPKVPLLSRGSRTPAGAGLLQLGLDENNQIKVYHY